MLNVMDPPYNATGDGVTDDRGAIQSALDDAAAAGGETVYFPAGRVFAFSSTLWVLSGFNITLRGEGGRNEPTGPAGSTLRYTGSGDRRVVSGVQTTAGSAVVTTASAAFTSADVGKTVSIAGAGSTGNPLSGTINSVDSATQITISRAAALAVNPTSMTVATAAIRVASSDNAKLEKLQIEYTNTSFTGNLVDCTPRPTSSDYFGFGFAIDRCRLTGSGGATGASRLVELHHALNVTIKESYFTRAVNGINGYGDYGVIEQNGFSQFTGTPILNLRQCWDVASNSSVGLANGDAGFYDYDDATGIKEITFRDNWFGDSTSGAGTWIRFKGRFCHIEGNQFEQGGLAVELVGTVRAATILTNFFRTSDAIKLSSGVINTLTVIGNDIDVPGTKIDFTAAPTMRCVLGNIGLDASYVTGRGLGVGGVVESDALGDANLRVLLGEHTANGSPGARAALLAYLSGDIAAALGVAAGSLGIFPRSNLSTAVVDVFAGDAATPSLEVAKTTVRHKVPTALSRQTVDSDANLTFNPATPERTYHTGTLTANRTITLATNGMVDGQLFTISRAAGVNACALNVGPGLKSLAPGSWVEVTYDGSAWYVSAAGSL